MENFNQLGLSEQVIQAINSMGFEEPTPIQEQTIPIALEGHDLIGQAQTGTGKTAAFGIPIIEKIMNTPGTCQAIVLTPTRELTIQLSEEINKIGQQARVKALPIYGGQDMGRQIRALKNNPQIIIATPGRLMDHMRRKTITLDSVKIVVLDEADEMLNRGFLEDMQIILQETPKERQTLLFSATMPRQIQNLTHKFMRDAKWISVQTKDVTVPLVEQSYVEIHDHQKFDVLCRLFDIQSPELAIVFVRTKKRVDEITEFLKQRGYSAEGIHGDLTQAKRDSVLRQFKTSIVDVLVATDVAARGLDISGVTHVYNFDIPQDSEGYVHRIGRTARAGQSGLAISFVLPREIEQLHTIERTIKRKITRMLVPTITDVIEGQQQLVVNKLLAVLEEGDTELYKGRAVELLNENDSVGLLAAALKMLTKEPDTEPVRLTEDTSFRNRQPKMRKSQNKPAAKQHRGKSFSGSNNSNSNRQRHGARS